ncbi:periodic tryptophan protein 2 homolog [Anthonomus grandis grandis]|uniref:periodic tryptophan protein 2 homolog n=1 Tax=Anthonomus grandis grandis TaxID=2921223 RepID=UPI002166AB63|nr:periodic tryptophan protein 2 homolog [Anthonomus grandis grandis]
MKFSYKFSNLLGTVYRKGDLLFTPDGNSVISCVGNRISLFDLRNNRSNTLPIESRYNYVTLDLSPNGCTLIAINEEGEAHMISLISQTIVHRYRFKGKCRAVRFSPDGKHFAVCKDNNAFVFKAPGPFSGEYNAFVMERVFHGAYDETTCLDWSFDSKLLAIGSKDMATKIYPLEKCKNFRIYSLGNHTDGIVGCFFEKDTYDIITVARNGQTCVWECTIDPSDLHPLDDIVPSKKKKTTEEDEEDDIDITKSLEKSQAETEEALKKMDINDIETGSKEPNKLFYKRVAKHYLSDEVRKDQKDAILTSAAYNKASKILVTGFSSGAFVIHEAPDMNLIHSLSISDQKISSVALNHTGDWIALGCSGIGQLLVWEWQSETYVMKQQGHANNMSCVAYSGDGQLLATGGHDGKVKLWNIGSGFCFVTFSEHSSAITAISFSGNKKFVVSASLDGTVRAYDVIRYRNFKTFTSPRPVQISCVAVDGSGEFVAAGGQDVFEIYLWSIKTGRLLEIVSGHEGPVAGLAFSPSMTNTTLASVSWDKTLRIWDAIEKGSAHETIELIADGVNVTFNPNGLEVAVATLDGQISVFNVKTATQVVAIEGRNDLGSGRSESDLITAKKNLEAKSFTTLCYSADGEYLLAGGQSKNVCIYNVKEALLVKKFEITQNRSMDAVDDFINRRKLTEFGNLALIEEREEREGGNVMLKLPGVRKGDMSSRSIKPEVRVLSLQFSPTGQQWAAATTEGLLIYSLNTGLVFDPWDLQIGITPMAVKQALKEEDYLNALTMAIKINESSLIQEVMEMIPVKDVQLIVSSLQEQFIERLLLIIASGLDSSRHLEYYLYWIQHTLTIHGPKISGQKSMPALLALEKCLVRRYEQISKLCDYNKYSLQYITMLGKVQSEKQANDIKMADESDTDSDSMEAHGEIENVTTLEDL